MQSTTQANTQETTEDEVKKLTLTVYELHRYCVENQVDERTQIEMTMHLLPQCINEMFALMSQPIVQPLQEMGAK